MGITRRYRWIAPAGFSGVVLLAVGGCASLDTQPVQSRIGPQAVHSPMTIVSSGERARLVDAEEKPVEIGRQFFEYRIPFLLTAVPEEAKLEVNFVVMEKLHCSLVHGPTYHRGGVFVNGRLLARLDLGPVGMGQRESLLMDVPRGALRAGENSLIFQVGQCAARVDFEVVRLNSVTLTQHIQGKSPP